MFEPTRYDERVAHALGLNYQELQDKFKQGELEHKRAGCDGAGATTVGVMKTQTLCFRPSGKSILDHCGVERKILIKIPIMILFCYCGLLS